MAEAICDILEISLSDEGLSAQFDIPARMAPAPGGVRLPSRVHAVVLVSRLHAPAMQAIAFARASRPDQLEDNVKASGVVLEPAVLAAIDAALEPVIERNPALTAKHAPRTRP